MRKKPDWFLLGMFLAIALAWRFPAPGADGGMLHPELLTKLGIALVFFLNGALLSFAALRDGVRSWQLHGLIQGTTFLVFPLIGLGLMALCRDAISPPLLLGLFYLCALPSTVSSSVAMTAAARGNVPVAVFNATLSSIIGVTLTPFWMGVVLHQQQTSYDLGTVMLDLAQWLLLPLMLGQLSRPLIGAVLAARKRWVNKVDRGTILLLVYTSFCDSFANHVWSGHGTSTMLLVLGITCTLFFAVLLGLCEVAKLLRLTPADRAAMVFCGTKKSLVTGIPMAQLLFAGDPQLGLILLPILVYHPLQLFICAPLASHWARRA